jgi:hypothetical protein
MRVSSKADYAVRAMVELAGAEEGAVVKENVRAVLENVSLADVLAGELPAPARPAAR